MTVQDHAIRYEHALAAFQRQRDRYSHGALDILHSRLMAAQGNSYGICPMLQKILEHGH